VSFGAVSVKGRALHCLAQREHSRAELERKLLRQVGDSPPASAKAQIATALDELEASGLLSDSRTAEAVLAGAGRRMGWRRLKQTLRAKGLDDELVASCTQSARTTELDRAREVWRRRFPAPPADKAERARQAQFLLRRGFDGDVVARLVGGTCDED
jgi:regulatory protein